MAHGLSCPEACGILVPRPGVEPLYPLNCKALDLQGDHEFEQAPGVGDRQGSLLCCHPWGRKESDTTERLNCDRQGSPQCLFLMSPSDTK